LAICGLSLAFAALGNLLFPITYGEAMRYICGIISAIILIVFVLKIMLDFKQAREKFKTPVVLSVLPASTMSLMLLCVYSRPYIGVMAVVIWYAAIAAQLCFMWLFIKRFILSFKLSTVLPSWFITFVGIAVVSITAPAMTENIIIGQMAFYVGFVLYFVVLALIVCRMVKVKSFPEPARPTIAIFTAPMSLLIVGYFNSFAHQGQQNETLIYFMLTIAIVSYIFVTVKMFSLLKIKFYPTYAAFAFPYVISAIAFRIAAAFLAQQEFYFFAHIAHVSQWIAVAVVLYVLGHYIRFLYTLGSSSRVG